MGNAILCSNYLASLSGTTAEATTEATGYDADNLRVFQPGQAWRSTSLAQHGIGFAYEVPQLIDTFALVGTNLTPHPNLLQYSNAFDTVAAWTPTNATVNNDAGVIIAPNTADSHSLNESTDTGTHYLEQTWTAPASGDIYGDVATFSVYVGQESGTRHCRIRLSQGAAYIYQDFNLSSGATQGSLGTSGAVSGSATVTAVTGISGSTYYRVSITATAGIDAADDIAALIYILDDSYTLSYAGDALAYGINISGSQLEFASAPSAHCLTTTDTGALWKPNSQIGIVLAGNVSSTWRPVRTADCREELSDRGFINVSTVMSASGYGQSVGASIFDPNNLDGYLRVGTLVAGESLRPTTNIAAGHRVGWSEHGDTNRSPGGQIYRPQNKLARSVAMDYQFLTEAEALAEAHVLQRRVGRSRGVLVSVDPDGSYPNESTIWGLLEQPGEVTRRVYSTTLGGNVYSSAWEVVEALP